MDQLGISRPSENRIYNLGLLPHQAAIQSIGLAFDSFGVRGTGRQRTEWVARIAEASRCWPQHLTILTKAALSELKAQRMDINETSLDVVLDKGEDRKLLYYAKRLEKVGHGVRACQAIVACLDGKPYLSSHEIERAAIPHLPAQEAPLNDFLTEAIHAGVLSRVGPDHYSVPIPSFADYIRHGGAPVPQEENDPSSTCMEQPWERGLLALDEGRMPSLPACSLRSSAAAPAAKTPMDF